MKSVHAFVLAISALAVSGAHAATKEEVISDALKKGATFVVCDNDVCRNTKTHELVGQGENGVYLMYPPGHEEEERQTARLLAQAR